MVIVRNEKKYLQDFAFNIRSTIHIPRVTCNFSIRLDGIS